MRTTEMRAMATGQAGTVKTVADALAGYAEKVSPTKGGERKEQIRLKAFLKHARFPAKVRLSELTPQHLVNWHYERLKVTSRGTVLRDMVLMSHVLETARREWP